MKVYRGDLLPDLVIGISDGDGNAVDLTAATSIHVIGVRDREVVFDRSASGDAQGNVTMEWQAADTDQTGTIHLQVRVIWAGDKPQTFPVDEPVEVAGSYHVGV